MRLLKLKKLNNKGFSLVELVIATAILAMVSLTVMGLMSTGSKLYNTDQKRTMALFKSQVAGVQLQKEIVSCTDAIYFDEGTSTLVLADKASNTVTAFYIEESEKAIYTYTFHITVEGGNISFMEDNPEPIPFCYNATGFDVKIFSNEDGQATAVKFDLSIEKLGMNYTKNYTVSLRNKPQYIVCDNFEQFLAAIWG